MVHLRGDDFFWTCSEACSAGKGPKKRSTGILHDMNEKDLFDPYDVLGVSSSSTLDEIKTAFRNLARRHHPDKLVSGQTVDKDSQGSCPASQLSGDAQSDTEREFIRIRMAYEVLTDPEKRQAWNAGGSRIGHVSLGAVGEVDLGKIQGYFLSGSPVP